MGASILVGGAFRVPTTEEFAVSFSAALNRRGVDICDVGEFPLGDEPEVFRDERAVGGEFDKRVDRRGGHAGGVFTLETSGSVGGFEEFFGRPTEVVRGVDCGCDLGEVVGRVLRGNREIKFPLGDGVDIGNRRPAGCRDMFDVVERNRFALDSKGDIEGGGGQPIKRASDGEPGIVSAPEQPRCLLGIRALIAKRGRHAFGFIQAVGDV